MRFEDLPKDLRQIAESYRKTTDNRIEWSILFSKTDLPEKFWRYLNEGMFSASRMVYNRYLESKKLKCVA